MASHLTVTTAGTSGSKAVTVPFGGDVEGGAGDVFATLLGTATPQGSSETGRSASAAAQFQLGNLVNLSLGFGGGGAGESEDPEGIAAVIDALVPLQDTAQPVEVLNELASSLSDLKARLAAGEPLDAEALSQLEAALAELAAMLDIDPSALPSLDDLTALITDLQPDDQSFAARLTAAFGPLAETLFSGTTAPQAEAGAELSALLKSIGDKLAALLSALNGGDIGPDQLAQLELAAKADTELQAALAKLLQPALSGNAAPALATPELKLTEPALTGKAADAANAAADGAGKSTETAETSTTAQGTAGDSGQPSGGNGDAAPQDRKPADPRPTAVAAPVETPADPQAAAQPAPAARVDIVAAPRVVQAGYQTSQQQLNLPQLAFELVRQVGDGNTRFQIRLDPPELGRIDVKLDIDKGGQVNARLTVEKAETLDLMQRDQRALERALQQAGLDGARTNLEFSLKQNPFGSGQQGEQGGNGRNLSFGDEIAADADETPPPTVSLYRGSLTASGVNIIA